MRADDRSVLLWSPEGLGRVDWASGIWQPMFQGDRPGIDMVLDSVASVSGDELVMVSSTDRCTPEVISIVNTGPIARLPLDALGCTVVSGVWLSPDGATVAVHYEAQREAGETDRLALVGVDDRVIR